MHNSASKRLNSCEIQLPEEPRLSILESPETKHENARYDEEGVTGDEGDENRVDGRLHLRPAEDHDGDHVAQEAEATHYQKEEAVNHHLEDVEVVDGCRLSQLGLGRVSSLVGDQLVTLKVVDLQETLSELLLKMQNTPTLYL